MADTLKLAALLILEDRTEYRCSQCGRDSLDMDECHCWDTYASGDSQPEVQHV
jgi:hypothetical protein